MKATAARGFGRRAYRDGVPEGAALLRQFRADIAAHGAMEWDDWIRGYWSERIETEVGCSIDEIEENIRCGWRARGGR